MNTVINQKAIAKQNHAPFIYKILSFKQPSEMTHKFVAFQRRKKALYRIEWGKENL